MNISPVVELLVTYVSPASLILGGTLLDRKYDCHGWPSICLGNCSLYGVPVSVEYIDHRIERTANGRFKLLSKQTWQIAIIKILDPEDHRFYFTLCRSTYLRAFPRDIVKVPVIRRRVIRNIVTVFWMPIFHPIKIYVIRGMTFYQSPIISN